MEGKGKHILYINQYFKQPNEPGITRSYWIAKELINRGYTITMLAHRNTMLKQVGDVPKVEKTVVDGIEVIYIRNEYSNDMGIYKRAVSFVKFMLASAYYANKMKNVDLVIATSTPLTVAFPALIRNRFKKTPFIFEVRDLWPEVPIQMGAIKNKFAVKFLKWFEKTTYLRSEHVIALSPGMQEGVVKYIPESNTTMIPNMAKIDKFWRRPINEDLFSEFGFDKNSFKAIYFGTLGQANGLDYIMDAIFLLDNAKESNLEFIFLGDGKIKNDLIKKSATLQYVKVTFVERQPMDIVSEILNACDVSIVTFSDIPILTTNSPNKLFDTLSAGKPSIVNSAGWTKDIVEKGNAGFYVNPSKASELAEKILVLKNNPELSKSMGESARKLAETTYDKSVLCAEFADVVDDVMAKISKK